MKTSIYLKAFSDPNKMRIIHLLMEREICVQQLERILNLKQANISKHLMTLKRLNIVDCRKDKTRIFYRLNDNFKSEFELFFECLRKFRTIEPILVSDQQALSTLPLNCDLE